MNEILFQKYFYLYIFNKDAYDFSVNKSKKMFRQNIYNQSKIVEIFLEKLYFQTLTCIYIIGEKFPQKIYFSSSRKLNSILSFSFKKKTTNFKIIWSRITRFQQNIRDRDFKILLSFQTSKQNNAIFYNGIFDNTPQLENMATIFELIKGRNGKINMTLIYKTLRINKSKALNIMYLWFNGILKDKLKKKVDLNEIIKGMFGNNSKKGRFILRNRKISPSSLRVFKCLYYYYFNVLRDPLKLIKEKSLFFSIFFFKSGNPFSYDLYLNVFKYFQRFEDNFNLDGKKRTIEKNFKFQTDFTTNYCFSKTTHNYIFTPWIKFFNYTTLFIRINLRYKLLNWGKNISLFLKELNNVKFNLNSHISEIGVDFKKFKKFNFFKLDLLYNEKRYKPFIFNRFMVIERYQRNLQYKYKQDTNISLITLIRGGFMKNHQLLILFGILLSLLFNNKYCENFFHTLLNENLTFVLSLWAFNFKSFQKFCGLIIPMQNIEKKNFLKILKFYFLKKSSIFNFFIKKFLNIDSTNYIPFIKKKTFLFELFLITLGFQKFFLLKSHPNSFLYMMIIELSSPFFYKRTKDWIISFKIFNKMVQNTEEKFLSPSRKTFDYMGRNIISYIQEKIFFWESIQKHKRKSLSLSILYITIIYSQSKKNQQGINHNKYFQNYNYNIILGEIGYQNIFNILEKTYFHQMNDQILIDFDLFSKKKLFSNELPEIFLFLNFQPKLNERFIFWFQFFFSFIKGVDFLIEFKLRSHYLSPSSNYCKVGFKTRIKCCPNYENSMLLRDFLYIKNSSLCKTIKNEVFMIQYIFMFYEPKNFPYSFEVEKYLENQTESFEEKVVFLNEKFIKKFKRHFKKKFFLS
jgi:hypothetical protein